MVAQTFKRVGAALLLLCVVFAAQGAEGRQIVDMAGRNVSVPDVIRKVYGGSPPATYMVYAIDPSLVAGLNYPFDPKENRFLRPSFRTLPVIGGWFGQGRTPNLETLLDMRPDVMIVWMWRGGLTNATIERVAEQLRLPLVYIRIDRLSDYPEAFRFLGRLMDREERAGELGLHAARVLSAIELKVTSLPPEERVSVYYAEAPDGLSSECDKSPHAELIGLAGGRNVYECEPQNDFGMERISVEQVMVADPEVIVAQEKEFVDGVHADPRWQTVRAVKNRRVHLIPRVPFNWFDRPPSFMRILGVRWLANLLHPDRIAFDAARDTREFYRLFLGVELDEDAVREVLRK